MPAANLPTKSSNTAPWNVTGVASTATRPLRVAAAAGFTAGSIPTIGTANTPRRGPGAAADPALQAAAAHCDPPSPYRGWYTSAHEAAKPGSAPSVVSTAIPCTVTASDSPRVWV